MTPLVARGRWRRIGTALVALAGLVAVLTGPASGQEPVIRREDLKATFLYNFAKFVEWPGGGPDKTAASFPIEIIGRDPFDGRFDQLMIGKKINDQPIEVIHSLDAPSPKSVRVVFVSLSEDKRLEALLTTYRRNRVLTVSDIADFTQRGGIIGFLSEPGAVRFRINQAAAERSRLQLSSRLLLLAR
jgi:YfiR/HmsC-like